MKEFKEYLENQFIKYSLKGNIFEIGGETFSVSEYSKTVINEDFELVNRPNEYSDYYAFKFGGKWYYTPSDEKKVTLNRLINIGTYDGSDTEVFLGVHGGFEILNGSGLYDSWCKRAKFLRTNYLGICEKNTLAGVMKFQQECLKQNLVPIIGATFTVRRISPEILYDIKCFVKNDKGWENLLKINYNVNVANNGFIDEPEFMKLTEGVKVVFDPKSLKFKDIFPYDLKDFYYQLDTVIFDDENVDREYLDNLKNYFNSSGEPLPFTDAYYINKEDFKVKEILNKVASKFDLKSSNQYFKSKDDYFYELNSFIKSDVRLVDLIQRLLRNEKDFVGDIGFKIETGIRHLPRYIMTPVEASKYKTNEDLFWGLISEGLSRLNLDPKSLDFYISRVEKEVSVIEKGNVLDYFLILHDIISWCKRNDILVGVGRGSAGGSLVSYCLGLIHLDPLEFDLLFERFLNEGRLVKSIPDIDVDFESRRRGDIKSYMEKRFGELQVISIGTYTALQLRACIKDIGRVFNLTFDETNKVTAFLGEANSFHSLIEIATKDKLIRNFVIENTELVNYIPLIHGQPKARSVHACAMVIFPSDKTMFEWAPIYKHDDILVSEWEGEEIEKAGFLKEDILGVAQLDKFRMVLDLIKRHHGVDVNIYTIPYDDEKVYRLFRKGFNSDIFHFGSRGLTKYCTELLPENIEDLVAGISLYRPGAIENNFHNQYVLRKHGEQEVTYPIGAEEILSKTYGVFVYQEQIMKLCQVLGGLSLVEADDVRKAMVKKRYDELNKYKERFIPYYVENFKVSEEYAVHVWDQIDKASTYLFNRCISGEEKIKSIGVPFKYTIGEMWKLRNDPNFYKTLGLRSDNYSYVKDYGNSYSLDERNRLVKNKIKDIRYVGIRDIFKLTLVNGETICVTDNHKFPTSNGEKMLKNIEIGVDKIFYNIGYIQEKYFEPLMGDGVLNSSKGVEGFLKKGENSTEFLKLKNYKKNFKKNYCELCGASPKRLEIHHKDLDHSNNNYDNLITLCVSCHKKEHYKKGRVKIGEKGLYTELIDIKSIELVKKGEVYDVEMEHPYHTFVNQNNIVTSNSHAAAYAITSYIGQWFKVNYPIEFWTTAFNFISQDDINKGVLSNYLSEVAKTNQIEVVPVEINGSSIGVSTDSKKVFWSISSVKQVGEISSKQIIEDRERNGKYFSFEEFISRHNFIGSKVNKSVIENLTICGSFDLIEGIKHPSERIRLIKYYREFKGIKPSDNDWLVTDERLYEDWWWSLKQKELSGISFFDYRSMCDKYLKDSSYVDQNEFQSKTLLQKKYYSIGGIVTDVMVRNSKTKGKYCFLTIESNYESITVSVFPDMYKKIKEIGIDIENSKGSILLCTGLIKYDDYRKENVLKIWDSSEISLLN